MDKKTAKPEPLDVKAQQENALRDDKVMPHFYAVGEKMENLDKALTEAKESVSNLYRHSDPVQQKALDKVEKSLIDSHRSADMAKDQVHGALPNAKDELGKATRTQFNAAGRGDPRSVVKQTDKQNSPLEREPRVEVGKPSEKTGGARIDEIKGAVKAAFKDAKNGQTQPKAEAAAKPKEMASQQVANSAPHPVLKPGPGLAAGGDRMAHQNAMQKDRKNAVKAQAAALHEARSSSQAKTGDQSQAKSSGKDTGLER